MTHETIERAYRAGFITDREYTEQMEALAPRCRCGKPTQCKTASGYMCPDCLSALDRLTTDGYARVARGRM